MHCPGHNTVRGAGVGYYGSVKNNVPYLEGQFVGGRRLEIRDVSA